MAAVTRAAALIAWLKRELQAGGWQPADLPVLLALIRAVGAARTFAGLPSLMEDCQGLGDRITLVYTSIIPQCWTSLESGYTGLTNFGPRGVAYMGLNPYAGCGCTPAAGGGYAPPPVYQPPQGAPQPQAWPPQTAPPQVPGPSADPHAPMQLPPGNAPVPNPAPPQAPQIPVPQFPQGPAAPGQLPGGWSLPPGTVPQPTPGPAPQAPQFPGAPQIPGLPPGLPVPQFPGGIPQIPGMPVPQGKPPNGIPIPPGLPQGAPPAQAAWLTVPTSPVRQVLEQGRDGITPLLELLEPQSDMAQADVYATLSAFKMSLDLTLSATDPAMALQGAQAAGRMAEQVMGALRNWQVAGIIDRSRKVGDRNKVACAAVMLKPFLAGDVTGAMRAMFDAIGQPTMSRPRKVLAAAYHHLKALEDKFEIGSTLSKAVVTRLITVIADWIAGGRTIKAENLADFAKLFSSAWSDDYWSEALGSYDALGEDTARYIMIRTASDAMPGVFGALPVSPDTDIDDDERKAGEDEISAVGPGAIAALDPRQQASPGSRQALAQRGTYPAAKGQGFDLASAANAVAPLLGPYGSLVSLGAGLLGGLGSNGRV